MHIFFILFVTVVTSMLGSTEVFAPVIVDEYDRYEYDEYDFSL